jgi:hypothetical protein
LREIVWPVRTEDDDCSGRPACGAGDDYRALSVRAPRVLEQRQLLVAERRKAATRLRAQWPTLTLVHTPNHASWLNQVEIYFSVVQRKVVTPNDFASLRELEDRLLAFHARCEQTAKPFQWTFTRDDLVALKLQAKELGRAA